MPEQVTWHDAEVFVTGAGAGAIITLVFVRIMVARIVGQACRRRRDAEVIDFTAARRRRA